MPQNERLRVWRGELKKTSGGLTKAMLMKNKRGKIVSKRKSEAAKKNANNLGDWLRSKGDHFLSKGLKQENIVRKGKAGRKAFKKPEVPEEKQAEVPKKKKVEAPKPKPKPAPPKPKAAPPKPKAAPPKPKKAPPKPDPKKKKVVPKAAPKKKFKAFKPIAFKFKAKAKPKTGPPKITKVAPVGPGEKPTDKSNISAGNIVPKKKKKQKPKVDVNAQYIKLASEAKHVFEDTLEEVIAELGPLPPGVKWEDI